MSMTMSSPQSKQGHPPALSCLGKPAYRQLLELSLGKPLLLSIHRYPGLRGQERTAWSLLMLTVSAISP